MGTWIKGYEVAGGVLYGQTFEGGGDLDDVSWQAAPQAGSNILVGCNGEIPGDGIFEGINCLADLKMGDPSSGTIDFWLLKIDQNDYYAAYVVLQVHFLNTTGSFEYSVVKRVYTDASTYTDTNITNTSVDAISMYFSNQYLDTNLAHAVFFQSSYGASNYVFMGFSWQNLDWLGNITRYLRGFAMPVSRFSELLGGDIPGEEKSPEFGPGAKPKGGYNEKSQKKGTFDDHSDVIAPTALPTEGVSTCGFIHVYTCNRLALEHLGGHLFPAPASLTDVVELIRNRYDMDYIVGCKLLPLRPSSEMISAGKIIVGYHTYICGGGGATVRAVTSDYVEVDLGSIGWAEYWANFLDYAGTSAQLFLPFLGFVPIEPEFWNGGGLIHLIFRMNCITGDFVYLIRSSSGMSELENSLIAQYGGNCSVEIPVTGVQGGQAMLNLGMGIAQIANGVQSDSFSGAATGVQKLCGLRPDVPKSGGLSASAAFFGHRRPFLLIKRQDSQFSEKYPEEVGLPLYMQKRLGDCTGLTIARNAHLDTIPADVEIKEKINQLLAEGVIL